MNRLLKGFVIAFLGCAFFGTSVQAATVKATSCDASAVQNAIDSAASGDTVTIPAGDCVWSTSVSTSLSGENLTIQGAGAQTPAGGTDQTIIEDDVNHSGSIPPMWQITLNGGSFRLTGIAFETDPDNTTVPYNGIVRIGGSSNAVQVDHCHFNTTLNGSHVLQLQGDILGVADNNLFYSTPGIVTFDLAFYNGINWDGGNNGGRGNASWAKPVDWGSDQFFFAEDNLFENGWVSDCHFGGRYVLRHNTILHSKMMDHGLAGDVGRSCRAMEVYDNTFTYSDAPKTDNYASVLQFEGGTGLFWGNTITGYVSFIHEDVVRTNKATYTQLAPPNGWGYCGSSVTGALSPWDENTNSTGYACMDGVGRGEGDLLSGSGFPKVLNTVTGKQSWPNQALDPVYAWDNTFNPVGYSTDAYWSNYDKVTVENRDYYLQVPNLDEPTTIFNGTVGIGQGLLSARPSTCTPRVAYWATDANNGNGELYVCTEPNSWKAYYTPYIYPYPLDATSSNNPPQYLHVITVK